MSSVQQTQDDIIFVRTDSGIYRETLANFKQDYGKAFSGVPSPYVALYYDTDDGTFTYTDKTNKDHLQDYPWSKGDDIIASFSNLVKAKEARDAPVNPTVDEAKTQQINAIIDMIPFKLQAGVTFNGILYKTDTSFTTNVGSILNVINAGMYPNTTVAIKDATGTPQTLSVDNFKKLAGNAIAFGQSVYQQAWAIEEKIKAVGTEPNWVASHVYSKGDVIQDSGYIYEVTQAGTSSKTKPTFSNKKGNTTTDNNMIWTCQGTLQDVIFAITWN